MKKITKVYYLFLIFLAPLLMSCSDKSENPVSPSDEITQPIDPFEQNRLIGRGINLGNALEAPKEGEWGVTLKSEFFQVIKEKGFNSIRVPIKWSSHALLTSPYTIEQKFFERIDWVINEAKTYGLATIINIHHYDEIMTDPAANKDRFLKIWEQISARYKKHSGSLFFEILNEPNNRLSSSIWNQFIKEAIEVIRKENPYRTLIVGPANWNSIYSLSSLSIPSEEKNVIVTFHYYNPFQFTHQGAEWVDGSTVWLGTKWNGTEAEKNAVTADLDVALTWSIQNNRPLYLGEFGAYSKADYNSRARWNNFVARSAEERNISWSYWEFCAGFGVYDQTNKTWYDLLLTALIPPA